MAKIIPPSRLDAFVDSLARPVQRVNSWLQTVSESAQTLSGTASPEGVIDGKLGWKYCDTANSDYYVKFTDGGNTGWVKVNP